MAQKPDPFIEVGTVFQGRYEILGKISHGAFGVVYKARQRSTGQHVAVKCLLRRGRDNDDEDRRRVGRFRREMQLCARLRHPNIVRLIDSGQVEETLLYTVFEYIPGKTLAQVLTDEHRISLTETRHIMAQVLDALSSAHARGIVHRDLKPSNLMVMPTGARRNAMVLDFGIGAITRDARLEGYMELTGTLERVGTPAYAAPEQLRGKSSSPRSDLYSWGLVFIECITGKRVFWGESVPDIIHRQLESDPVPIPAALIGHPLEKLLKLVTVKDVHLRRITAKGLLEMLDACDLSAIDTSLLAGNVALQRPESASTLTIGDQGITTQTPQRHGSTTLPSISEGERRQLTVVSCLLEPVPVPERDSQPDDQSTALLPLLQDRIELCTELARHHSAHVVSDGNGRVIFYLGYPQAHGDDARRAARAALEILAAFEARSSAQAAMSRTEANLRIAVHTGLAVVRLQKQRAEIIGNLASIANLLASRAEPGRVVVSATTWRLLRQHFVCSPTRGSGGGPEESIYELMHSMPGLETSTSSLIEPLAPLLGRDSELELLMRSWRHASQGQGQAVLITGEAGIGKTRLVREIGERVSRSVHRWLECRCTSEGRQTPLQPVLELIERQLGSPTDPETKHEALVAWLKQTGLAADDLIPLLGPLIGARPGDLEILELSSERRKELTIGALVTVLGVMAVREPLVFVVEDVQWADPTTIELVADLLAEAPAESMLVLLTAPADFESPWRVSELVHVQLRRLDPHSVATMIDRLSAGVPLPEEVFEEISRRADGVPLFIEEVTRTVLESGALVRQGDGYALVGSLAELEIPATLRDSLMARLDRLGTAKTIAQIAALIGREVSLEQLTAVTTLERAAVRTAMDELVAAEVVHRRRRIGNETYFFKHVLIQEVAYGSLPERTRREYHGIIAQVFEERFPDLASGQPELMARHYAGGGMPDRALDYLQQAGRRALIRSANAEAMSHAKEALRLAAGLGDEGHRAAEELGAYSVLLPALMAIRGDGGDSGDGFRALLARARETIDRAGDSPHVFSALHALFTSHQVHAAHDQALDAAERYLAQAERLDLDGQRFIGLGMMGSAMLYTGRLRQARGYLSEARALFGAAANVTARLALGMDPRVQQQSLHALCSWLLGYPALARELLEDSLATARALDHPMSTVMALYRLGQLECLEGNHEAALKAAAEQNKLAERCGRQWLLCGQLVHSFGARDLELAQRTLAALHTTGQAVERSLQLALVADIALACGAPDQAMERVAAGLDHIQRTGERFVEPYLHRLAARCLLAGGARCKAEERLERAIAVAHTQAAWLPELQAACALCRALAERGETAAAAERLRAALSKPGPESIVAGPSTPIQQATALLAELEPADMP